MSNIIQLNQDDTAPTQAIESTKCKDIASCTSTDQRPEKPSRPRKRPPIIVRLRQRTLRYLSARFKATRRFFHRHLGRWYISKLIAVAMRLNRPDFHVFITVSGHIGRIHLIVHPYGWSEDASAIELLNNRLPGTPKPNALTPGDIRKTTAALRALSRIKARPITAR